MTTRLAILLTSTALTVALGLPALAAMQAHTNPAGLCSADVCTALMGDDGQLVPLIRVDDDEDDEDGGWFAAESDDDEDEDDCDDEDEDDGEDDDDGEEGDDDDDDDCLEAGGMGNPAPAGTVAPPANGLFGNGAPPVAVTN